tara:strand:+ start:210 stop:329 length:120 start_codon:yes stop_codon:yes gene_type:complete
MYGNRKGKKNWKAELSLKDAWNLEKILMNKKTAFAVFLL